MNAISSWIVLAVHIVTGLVLTPFIIRNLGRTSYGIWILVGSFAGYYGLLNLGVTSAMTRYISRYTAQKDGKALNEVASTALAMFSITGALAILLSFALAPILADFFRVGPTERTAFLQLVRILGVTTGIGFPASVLGSIVTAREHYVAGNIVVLVQELLRVGLTVLFVAIGWGLIGIGLAPLTGTIVGVLSNVILVRVFAADVQLHPAHARMQVLGMLLLYGVTTTVISIADIMRGDLNSFIIGKYIGLPAVGIYGVALLVGKYISRLVVTGMGVLTPRFAALDGRGDREQLQRLLVKAVGLSSFLSFGACMAAIVFGKQFVFWWVGKDFAEAVVVLWILAAGSAFALAQNPAIGFMYALNKHYFYAIATIIEGIANLVLSLLLVRRYGMIGVAVGTLIPMLVSKTLVMPIYVSRIAGVSLRRYVAPMLPAALVAVAMVLAAHRLGIVTREASGFSDMFATGLVVAFVYVALWIAAVRLLNPGLLASLLPRRLVGGGRLSIDEKGASTAGESLASRTGSAVRRKCGV